MYLESNTPSEKVDSTSRVIASNSGGSSGEEVLEPKGKTRQWMYRRMRRPPLSPPVAIFVFFSSIDTRASIVWTRCANL